MRIAYGVMGYGRGHAMRTSAVLPALMAQHEVTVFAGADAYDVLSPSFPTVRIPTIGWQYNLRGAHSTMKTLGRNFAPMSDLLFRGRGSQFVEQELRARSIDLVISDSEAWTHRAAQKLGLPRISFDHVGIIAYCKPHFPADLWLLGRRDGAGYRALMGVPERILISSFYPAEGAYPNVHVVGPMLRDIVRETRAEPGAVRDDGFLLAYFNKGEHQYLPHLDHALRQLERPVVVYGTPFRGPSENLDFRAPSNDGFVRDLARCTAVLSTAGNQLIGEAIYLGKPILAVPEEAFEQRLNAYMIERMGVGMRGDRLRLTPSDIDRFLGNLDWYRDNMGAHARDGRAEATAQLLRFVDEVAAELDRRGPRAIEASAPTPRAASTSVDVPAATQKRSQRPSSSRRRDPRPQLRPI